MIQLEQEIEQMSQQRSNLLDLRDSCFQRVNNSSINTTPKQIIQQQKPVKIRERKKISLREFDGQQDVSQKLTEFRSQRETVFYKPYNYQKDFNEKSQLFDKSFEIIEEVEQKNSNLLNLQEISTIKNSEQRSFIQSNNVNKSGNNLLSNSFNIINKRNKSMMNYSKQSQDIQNINSLLNYKPERKIDKRSVPQQKLINNTDYSNRYYQSEKKAEIPHYEEQIIQRQFKKKIPQKTIIQQVPERTQRKSVSFKRGNQTVVIEQTAIFQAVGICLLVLVVLYYNIMAEYKNTQLIKIIIDINNERLLK